jgi:hypothetical protein
MDHAESPLRGAGLEDGAAELLRHAVATLAYRAEKVLREAPPGFAGTRLSPATRTPLEILSHLGDLTEWAARMARGEQRWQAVPATDWAEAAERFFRGLAELDAALAGAPAGSLASERILQGPIADALTHVGQLALIRGCCGDPVRPESYARADIRAGRVGRSQAPARAEFDGDASRPR